jgi:hypothetical protein
MGFNIAGLVINSNYNKEINKLSEDLNWKIEIIEEIFFEEVSSNWTPDDEIRIYFGKMGTMIFFSHELVVEQYHSKKYDTLNYAYSATVMAFKVDLLIKGKLVRSITEHEGDRKHEEGEPILEENKNKTADGLTFELIDKIMGEPFGGIDLSEKGFRCKMVETIKSSKEENNYENTHPDEGIILERDVLTRETSYLRPQKENKPKFDNLERKANNKKRPIWQLIIFGLIILLILPIISNIIGISRNLLILLIIVGYLFWKYRKRKIN